MSLELTKEKLVETLERASTPRGAQPEIQKQAEQQLKIWEVQAGYHFFLQSIYLDLSCSLQIRWLAIIQFKNGLDKYWRATRVNAISKDEKQSIRARLFEMVDEQNNQLCIQNAHACARIARSDYPHDWPDLFEYFEKALGDYDALQNNVRTYNVLVCLNQVVKLLASARVARCRPAMQSKMPLLFPLLVRVYMTNFNQWTSSTSFEDTELSSLQVSYLALKILRRAISDVYEIPHRDQSVVEFMDISVRHFDLLLSNHDTLKMFDTYEKFVKGYGKLYYNFITASPSSFILLPCCCTVLSKFTKLLSDRAADVYQENAEVNGDFWEQLSIRGFGILKRTINFIRQKGAVSLRMQANRAEVNAAIAKINTQFLNEALVTQLVDLLVDWYLKLRPAELDHWSLDPEDWMNEQMTSNYEYQIRPCAENFFQDLMNCLPDFLATYLLKKLEQEGSQLTSSLDDFLKKDAIFAAFQLSSVTVADMVDFDHLLINVFIPEAVGTGATSAERLRIIRRRVSLIVNEWCTVKCSAESKDNCYKLFLQLLNEDDDKVVQLSVIQALRTMVGDWDFQKESFAPYLNDFVVVLLRKVLSSVQYTETRLYVLNTLSDIIIQNKDSISNPLLMEVLQIVPGLWDLASSDQTQSILANALLRLLRYLSISLGAYSYNAWGAAIPIVETVCNPSSLHYSLLYEDGFELWSALLQNFDPTKAQLDPRLTDSLPFLQYAIANQTEILPTLLEIVKSYSLLLPKEQFFSISVFSSAFEQLSSYLLKLRDDSFEIFLSILDILTLADETDSELNLIDYFYKCGILKAIFDAAFLQNKLSNFQQGQLLQPVARIACINPASIVELLKNYHMSLPTVAENSRLSEVDRYAITRDDTDFDGTVNYFIGRWLACFSCFYDPKIKKIHILGISSLLKTGFGCILNHFNAIATIWVEILEEVNETADGDCLKYHPEPNSEYVTCDQLRQIELTRTNDPIHNVNLRKFIADLMSVLESELGSQYGAFLDSIDKSILSNLQIFLSVSPQSLE
ncbi:ACR159Cp [Eremothecium gossypii ATCC 10895]|uniref:ACR159Cp n=1 Tax=Eremothecium gossypii (strain ATCC 10895 / CBS 109.51 / FGSC 9923 / NRRL Y-1056) TaxID=284811 RepID=Q75BW2_EREGS|nr:ACR159Cp [Eremothecium gossypii ATCC 10895]AAS51385.2 ACR159Cp [Eremothecium gossypii ATCC 10895]